MTRHFEFVEGSSSKFWEVTAKDNAVTVRYGRIGSGGLIRTKFLANAAEAQKHADKLIAAKVKKGYQEVVAK